MLHSASKISGVEPPKLIKPSLRVNRGQHRQAQLNLLLLYKSIKRQALHKIDQDNILFNMQIGCDKVHRQYHNF